MTNQPKDTKDMSELLPVEQVDRDAAADTAMKFADYSHHWLRELRTGIRDYDPVVQAFARHRTRSSPPAPSDSVVVRLRRALEPFAQLAQRKANYVIRPNDPIVLEAVRALAK